MITGGRRARSDPLFRSAGNRSPSVTRCSDNGVPPLLVSVTDSISLFERDDRPQCSADRVVIRRLDTRSDQCCDVRSTSCGVRGRGTRASERIASRQRLSIVPRRAIATHGAATHATAPTAATAAAATGSLMTPPEGAGPAPRGPTSAGEARPEGGRCPAPGTRRRTPSPRPRPVTAGHATPAWPVRSETEPAVGRLTATRNGKECQAVLWTTGRKESGVTTSGTTLPERGREPDAADVVHGEPRASFSRRRPIGDRHVRDAAAPSGHHPRS